MASERIRFHLDENVDVAIANALRIYGVDVTVTVEGGMRAASDPKQLEYARTQKRVIVTHDPDFLRIVKDVHDHAGVAFCQRPKASIRRVVEGAKLIYEVLTPGEMIGRVEFL